MVPDPSASILSNRAMASSVLMMPRSAVPSLKRAHPCHGLPVTIICNLHQLLRLEPPPPHNTTSSNDPVPLPQSPRPPIHRSHALSLYLNLLASYLPPTPTHPAYMSRLTASTNSSRSTPGASPCCSPTAHGRIRVRQCVVSHETGAHY